MESQDIKEDKRVKKNYIVAIVFVILFAIAAYGGLIWVLSEGRAIINETEDKLKKEIYLKTNCGYERDSLLKENKQLSIYKSLTKAMVHRDEASGLLSYKVGDIVYMKSDSSKVVIEDIVIGGSKYQYYIKYKVLHKDKSIEEVIPELIY